MLLKYILAFIAAFSSGVVIAGGVFSFIAIIGVVPRMAQRTATEKCIVTYENAIILGGIFGSLTMAFDFKNTAGYYFYNTVFWCRSLCWCHCRFYSGSS